MYNDHALAEPLACDARCTANGIGLLKAIVTAARLQSSIAVRRGRKFLERQRPQAQTETIQQ
jgi:hypothetical protein